MRPTRADMAAIIRSVALLALYFASLQDVAEGHPIQNHCHMSKYKKMQPSAMSPARKLQNLQHKKSSCHHGLRLKHFEDCDIKGRDRLMLTLYRVSLVVDVLENMNKTELVKQNLNAFSILESDLMNCEMEKSPELKNCRHHLKQYRETVTQECLKNDVLTSLVWILTEDMGQLIHGGQSPEEMIKADLHVTAKPPPAKKQKGKRKKKGKKTKKKAD
ncbi:uncharacterized protein LOC143809430 [Ranitomeya variabilis]|uniref:uncharacterized protein LOC143809430 n=1 Tax=Ranitomeya variabilis TaxID=490064 RepID=UPI004055A6E6